MSTAKIKITPDLIVDVTDPDNVGAVYADMIVEFRVTDGLVHLTFAYMCQDGFGEGAHQQVRVRTRLRLPPRVVEVLRSRLPSKEDMQSSNPERSIIEQVSH